MKTELEFLKHIKSEIKTAHFGEGISFNLPFIVKDIDERIKEIDEVTKKGRETLDEIKEFMETLKDFDVWKDWKNTNQIDEVEWDDSHELNNVMNKIIEDFNSWEEVTNGATYYDILDKTQKLEPIDWGNSLHCHHSDFLIDDNIYRLTWTIGGANNEEPIIERKIK